MQETWAWSLGQEDPLEEWLPTPVSLTGDFHGQRSPVGYSPWGHKESDKTKRGTFFFFLILYSFSPHLLPLAGTFMPFWCHPGSFSCFLLLAMHARVRPWALSLGLDPVVRLLLLLYLTFTLFCSQSAHLLPVSWNIHDFLIFVCVCRLSVWSKLSNSLGKYLGAHW